MATLLDNWREVLRTQNLPAGGALDPVSRWLLITRASVIPMTLVSAVIAASSRWRALPRRSRAGSASALRSSGS
jgi:hypothetical protein